VNKASSQQGIFPIRSWASLIAHGLCRTLTLLGSSTFQAAQKESKAVRSSMVQSMCARARTSEQGHGWSVERNLSLKKDMNVVN